MNRRGGLSTASSHHPWPALVLLSAALWLLLWQFSHTDLTLRTRSAQIAWFFSAFGVFLIAVMIVLRQEGSARRGVAAFIIATGIVFRLSLAPVRPVTTSDIYRYLWEGRVVNAGEDPFRDAPESARLSYLHDDVWRLVQMKEVPAAYPPVAQYVFALADRVPADRIVALKLAFALFDIGTLLLLPGLLAVLGRPREWALLYAWHPLIVGEVVARGHLDSVGIFFLVLALRLVVRPSVVSSALSGAALAASALAKGYAALALPLVLMAAKPRRVWFALGVAVTAVAAYAHFAAAGRGVFDGIAIYSQKWVGYGSVFPLVDAALAPFTAEHALLARGLCGLGMLAWVIALGARQYRGSDAGATCDSVFLALAGFYLLSPVLYPWYLSWTVPFLCLHPRPGWLALTGTVYLFYAQGFTPSPTGFWYFSVLEYGIPLLVAVGAARRAKAVRLGKGPDTPAEKLADDG